VKVLVVGSRRHLDAGQAAERAAFAEACRDMGRAFAERGHTLVVGTDDQDDADYWFVEGASAVEGARVIVYRPEADQRATPFLARDGTFDRVRFTYRPPRRGEWTSVQLQALSEADVLVLVGGRRTAEATGYSAAAVKKPVLAVPSFGGAARTVWPELQRYYRAGGISEDDEAALGMPWRRDSATVVVNGAQALARKAFRSDGWGAQVAMLVLPLVLMAGWVALFQRPFTVGSDVSFYAMLIIAALLGTVLRSLMRVIGDGSRLDPRTLLTEAAAGILVAFGFALLYWAGVVVINADVPSVPAKDFRRVAVSMSILGFAGSFLLNEAATTLAERLAKTLKGGGAGK